MSARYVAIAAITFVGSGTILTLIAGVTLLTTAMRILTP